MKTKKAYFFYRVSGTLEPFMYAWTTDKRTANIFNQVRTGFSMIVKESNEKQVVEQLKDIEQYELVMYPFQSSLNGKGISIPFPIPLRDVMLMESDQLKFVLSMMNARRVIPSCIFKDEVNELLDDIFYNSRIVIDGNLYSVENLLGIGDETFIDTDIDMEKMPDIDVLNVYLLINSKTINHDAVGHLISSIKS